MSKFLALFIFCSIFFLNLYFDDLIPKGISATVTATATPTPNASNDSFNMELDRNTFVIPCPLGVKCSESVADSAPIVVTVSNTKREDNSLRYKYTTSGGRVIGEGANVSWDLTDATPGTYTITVTIEDKSGNELQTITKTATAEDNPDDGDRCLSACPELSVDAPTTPTQAGEAMIFTANVRYGNVETTIYNWTISSGRIIEGQGTPTIKVATNPKMAGKIVEATANFKWDSICWEVCNKTASASRSVAAKKRKGKKL